MSSKKGKEFEELACEYLAYLGYKILFKNFRCKRGEIDIVALDGDVIVFVEVKGTDSLLDPAERIDFKKLKKIYSCIEEFLLNNPAKDCRVDALIVKGGQIEHLKNISL
ncbi:YraN family protein [Thermocrinis sp.]